MRLVSRATNEVIVEEGTFRVGQRVRVSIKHEPTASEVGTDILPDRPILIEWEVVDVDFIRNVAYAEPTEVPT